jgi:predicted 2-oxoglutarate/Fe(II)-dependent dioxygenase YbiX
MGPFVSAVVYLGGEYTGGEVRIYNGNTQDTVAIKQQAGFVLTYPSDTYHEVSKVTGGTRLSLVNFFGVKPPAPHL